MGTPLMQFDAVKQLDALLVFLPRLLIAAAVLFIFWLAYRATRKPLQKLLRSARFEKELIHLLVDNLYKFMLFLSGLIAAVNQLGVNIGAVLAGIGVAGIAVGLAAQDSLNNLIAGFLIFWDKPFHFGEWISLGDLHGKVVEITMRSTRIRTRENTYIVIPNQKIVNEVLTNHSKHGEVRVSVPIGIAFRESIPAARQVLLAAVASVNCAMPYPAPDVVVKQLGESSTDLLVRVWIANAENETEAFYQILERCKAALDAAGIEIPFPHRQILLPDAKATNLEKIKSRAGKK